MQSPTSMLPLLLFLYFVDNNPVALSVSYCSPLYCVVQILGAWDMRGKQLFHGIEIKVWAIACFVSPQECNDRALKNFSLQLMKISGETGMPIKSEPCFCKYAKKATDVSRSTFEFFLLSCFIFFNSLWEDLEFHEGSLPR